MKVIYRQATVGGGIYVAQAYKDAFDKLGHECMLWHGQNMVKVFDSFKPDLFISHVVYLNETDINYLNNHPEIKNVFWSFRFTDAPDTEGIISKDKELTKITNEDKIITKLNNVAMIAQFPQKKTEVYLNLWKKLHGIKILGIPFAADVINCFPVEPKEEYKCDASYVGFYFASRSKFIELVRRKYNFKVWGPLWTDGLGMLPYVNNRDVFCSTTVNLNAHNQWQREYGTDINPRTYNIAACKAFQVVDNVAEIRELFKEDEMVIGEDIEDYHEKVDYFIKHPEERLPYMEKAYKRVINEHTYFHRIKELLRGLRMGVKLKDDHDWQTEYPKIHAEQTKKIEEGKEAGLPPSLFELRNDFKIEDKKLIFKDKKPVSNAILLYETCLKFIPKSIFEVGFGYCNHLVSIKKLLPNISISGCDISPAMYGVAKKRYGDLLNNFNLKIEDFLLLNIDKKFDMVYSQAVVMHMSTERAKEAIKKMCKISNKYVVIIDGRLQIPDLKPFVEQFGKVTYLDEWAKRHWSRSSYFISPFIIEVKK